MLRFFSLFAVASASIFNCNTSALFRPTAVHLMPNPPIMNWPISMSVQFYNPIPATNGTIETSYSLNGIQGSQQSSDLCNSIACPILPGANNGSVSFKWPHFARGNLTLRSRWNNIGGDNLLCVKIKLYSRVGYLRPQSKSIEPLFGTALTIWKVDNRTCPWHPTNPFHLSRK